MEKQLNTEKPRKIFKSLHKGKGSLTVQFVMNVTSKHNEFKSRGSQV